MREIAKSPLTFPSVGGFDNPPQEWAADAWDLNGVGGRFAKEMSRSVSKIGLLQWGSAAPLAKVAAVLRGSQVVRLFEQIRDDSPHREAEFRPEFEQIFSRHAKLLPPPLTRDQVIRKLEIDEVTARELLGDDLEGA